MGAGRYLAVDRCFQFLADAVFGMQDNLAFEVLLEEFDCTQGEIDYLHDQHIFVPDVAEVENLLMLEPVIRTVARRMMKDPDTVFTSFLITFYVPKDSLMEERMTSASSLFSFRMERTKFK